MQSKPLLRVHVVLYHERKRCDFLHVNMLLLLQVQFSLQYIIAKIAWVFPSVFYVDHIVYCSILQLTGSTDKPLSRPAAVILPNVAIPATLFVQVCNLNFIMY